MSSSGEVCFERRWSDHTYAAKIFTKVQQGCQGERGNGKGFCPRTVTGAFRRLPFRYQLCVLGSITRQNFVYTVPVRETPPTCLNDYAYGRKRPGWKVRS